jgi:Caspase domain
MTLPDTWRVFCFALMGGLGLLTALPAQAEKRVALVIGNGAYANATPLSNPRNDAEDVAKALNRTGFTTLLGLDLTKDGMDELAIQFARAVRGADVAVFYYSGHAMQFAGSNYLMPVDAKLTDEADLRRMLKVDDIIADLQEASALRLMVLDSCRDNPLAEELKRSVGLTRSASVQRGLAHIDSPQGMIVAYATQSGKTAADGTGRNSPYTAAFLKHIETPEEIGTVFRRISADVYTATNHEQLPELSLSLIGEFYLKADAQAALTPSTPPASGPLVGHWSGTVMQPNSAAGNYEAIIELDDSGRGKSDYPSLKCGGTLTPVASVGPNSYRETLNYGQTRCVDGGIITLTPTGKKSIMFEWQQNTGGVTEASGELPAIP